jgi:hypothetical protein
MTTELGVPLERPSRVASPTASWWNKQEGRMSRQMEPMANAFASAWMGCDVSRLCRHRVGGEPEMKRSTTIFPARSSFKGSRR